MTDAEYESGNQHGIEFPDRNVNLTLTPDDINRMLDGGEAVWTGTIPGIKFRMTAEVPGEENDAD